MRQPKSESTPRIGAPAARPRARRHALTSLLDALLGRPPWRAGEPVEIAIAWTQTQLMWSAPTTCARRMGDSP